MESQAEASQETGWYYASQGFYRSRSKGELTLRFGSVLRVKQKRPNGWWYVLGGNGQHGWAPGSFLEPIKDLEEYLEHRKHWVWVKKPPPTPEKTKIPSQTPSTPPPGIFRLDTAAEQLAAANVQGTSFPATHTTWLNAPKPRPILEDTVRQKLIMVGPWKCGKTEALMTFAHGRWFGDDYFRPGIFESYVTDTEVDGKHVELALTDTSGNEDYVRLRPLSYPDTRVVILAFAIDRPSSLEEACALWVSESTHYCPDAPTVLVGLKEDLRDHPGTIRELATTNQKPVSYQQGLAAARYIGAAAYAECSAKMVKGVQDVFKAAAQLALYSPDGTRKDVSWRHRLCSVM